MRELKHISFFLEIQDVTYQLAREYKTTCKELLCDIGFRVEKEPDVEKRNLFTSLGFKEGCDIAVWGDECLRLSDISIDGNIYPDSLSKIEEKLQSCKTIRYNGFRDFGTVFIPSVTEARDYYRKHLEHYEEKVIQFMVSAHENGNKAWIDNPKTYYQGDIRVCIGYDVIYFFHMKSDEVLKGMVDKGMILSNNSLQKPQFALPDFFRENRKHNMQLQRGR